MKKISSKEPVMNQNNQLLEIFIELTEKDQVLQDNYIQVSKEMTDLFYRNLPDEEIEKFENTLKKL